MASLNISSARPSSAGRRGAGGNTPPPRPSAAAPLAQTPLSGGYVPQKLPTNNPIQFSTSGQASPRTEQRAKQANTLGAFLGNQQVDARQASYGDEGSESYEGGEDPSGQPSVLDAMYAQQAFPSAQEEESEDARLSPSEAVKAQNRAFQERDQLGMQRQQQLISPNAATGEGLPNTSTPSQAGSAENAAQPGLNVRQISADANYQRLRNFELSKSQLPPSFQDPNPAQQTMDTMETASEMAEWLQRGRKVLLFFTGVGTVTTLIEQNALVVNRMLMDGAVQAPFMGGRPPGAYERNPNLRKVDRMDLFLAGLLDVSAIVMIFLTIMNFLITILPFVLLGIGAAMAGQYFGEIGGALFTQLAN